MDNTEFIFWFNQTLAQHRHTLVCAESITAGLLASTIASAPGTLAILIGSIVTYDRAMKELVLGVPRSTLDRHSAESMETTNAMLRGLKALFPNASIHVAITGVASRPSVNYDPDKVAGQIYLAMSIDGITYTFETVVRPEMPDEWGNKYRYAAVRYILERILEKIGYPERISLS